MMVKMRLLSPRLAYSLAIFALILVEWPQIAFGQRGSAQQNSTRTSRLERAPFAREPQRDPALLRNPSAQIFIQNQGSRTYHFGYDTKVDPPANQGDQSGGPAGQNAPKVDAPPRLMREETRLPDGTVVVSP